MQEQHRLTDQRKNISWSDEHEAALRAVYDRLRENGIVLAWKGEPNASAIILYALEQEAKRGKRKAEKGSAE